MPSISERIAILRDFPQQLEQLTARLTSKQLTTAYNAPEWTVAQNIHHIADSHANAFIRTKFALVENNPTVIGYDQDKWANLSDANSADVAMSLAIINGLHVRWVTLLESLNDSDWGRTYYHNTYQKTFSLDDMLTTYADHCTNHLRQIREVMEKMS
jgi:hypothetical protein